MAIFAIFGMYQHWMRYSSQREYMRIAQACVVAVLALVGYVAVVQPKLVFAPPRGFVPVTIPAGVLVLFGLLMFVLLAAVRYAVHLFYERPFGGFKARAERDLRADRRSGRRRPPRPPRDPAQPGPGPAPRRASSTTTRASRACPWTAG